MKIVCLSLPLPMSRFFGTFVSPLRINKGSIIKHNNQYMKIVSKKSNPVGHQFEFKQIPSDFPGKFKVRSYDEIELVDDQFVVEIDKIQNDCIITTNSRNEQIQIPIELVHTYLKEDLVVGNKIGILMDGDVFVQLTQIASSSSSNNSPKWLM